MQYMYIIKYISKVEIIKNILNALKDHCYKKYRNKKQFSEFESLLWPFDRLQHAGSMFVKSSYIVSQYEWANKLR